MAKKIAGNPELDATMPTVEVNVHGRVYHMVFTNGAFSVALKKLREQKLNFNVLVNTDIRNLDEDTLPVMLFASFVTNHPDIKYAEVEAMIDINTRLPLADSVSRAYLMAMEDAKEKSKAKNAAAEV